MEIDYKKYLLSKEWKEKRAEAILLANGRCRVCNTSQRLEVHHRTYDRIGNEIQDDLTVLCHSCHALFSRRKENNKVKVKSIKQPSKKKLLTKEIARLSHKLKVCKWAEFDRIKKYRDGLKYELSTM